MYYHQVRDEHTVAPVLTPAASGLHPHLGLVRPLGRDDLVEATGLCGPSRLQAQGEKEG